MRSERADGVQELPVPGVSFLEVCRVVQRVVSNSLRRVKMHFSVQINDVMGKCGYLIEETLP